MANTKHLAKLFGSVAGSIVAIVDQNSTRWIRFGKQPHYLVGEENVVRFQKLIEEIHNSNEAIRLNFTPTQIENEVKDLLLANQQTEEAKEEFIKMVEKLSSHPVYDFEVNDIIVGAFLEHVDEIQLGPFRIEQTNKLYERLKSQYPHFDTPVLSNVPPATLSISVSVRASEAKKATELGKLEFSRFENLLAYMLNSNHYQVDVGHSKVPLGSLTNTVSKEVYAMTIGGPGFDDVDLDSALLQEPHTSWLWNASKLENPSEWPRRILRAADWIGRANRDVDPARRFVQLVIAIETLLTYQEKKVLISPSIVASISEGFAFLLGENMEARIEIERTIKDIYEKRSGIVHGGQKSISTEEIEEATDLLGRLLIRLTTDEEFLQFKMVADVTKWVKMQKFR